MTIKKDGLAQSEIWSLQELVGLITDYERGLQAVKNEKLENNQSYKDLQPNAESLQDLNSLEYSFIHRNRNQKKLDLAERIMGCNKSNEKK